MLAQAGLCGGRRRVAGWVALAARGASTIPSSDGARESLLRRRGVGGGGMGGRRRADSDVRPRARSVQAARSPKPPLTSRQLVKLKRPIQPMTCQPAPQSHLLCNLGAVALPRCVRSPALICRLQVQLSLCAFDCTRVGDGKLAFLLAEAVTKIRVAAS